VLAVMGYLCLLRFYYQAYTRSMEGGSEKLTPDGQPQWCVRYAPRVEGSYQVSVTVTNSSGTFTVKTASFQATQVSMSVFICVLVGITSQTIHSFIARFSTVAKV